MCPLLRLCSCTVPHQSDDDTASGRVGIGLRLASGSVIGIGLGIGLGSGSVIGIGLGIGLGSGSVVGLEID